MTPLNDYQKRRVTVTMRLIDQRLNEICRALRHPSGSPLTEITPDIRPEQIETFEASLATLRQRIVEGFETLGIDLTPTRSSARTALVAALITADISVQDLEGHRLRGFGPLSEADERKIEAVAASIREQLGKMGRLLAGEAPGTSLSES